MSTKQGHKIASVHLRFFTHLGNKQNISICIRVMSYHSKLDISVKKTLNVINNVIITILELTPKISDHNYGNIVNLLNILLSTADSL